MSVHMCECGIGMRVHYRCEYACVNSVLCWHKNALCCECAA